MVWAIGKPAYNKGIPMSEEQKMKLSKAHTGKVLSNKHKEKLSLSFTGRVFSEEHKMKIGIANHNRVQSNETRQKIRDARMGKTASEETKKRMSKDRRGDKNPCWRGGVATLPYCNKWTREFRERVRTFFGHRCVECLSPQNGKLLDVHHVNFNKMSCCDNTKPLFVTLCRSCHAKIRQNKLYWEQRFTSMIMETYEGKCYIEKGVEA